MKNKWLTISIALVLLLCACNPNHNVAAENNPAPSPAEAQSTAPAIASLVLTDLAGNQVEMIRKPTKVISLSPAVTEIIYALGCGGSLMGVDEGSDYPSEAAALPRYSLEDISAIIAAEPDAVLVQKAITPAEFKALQDANIRVAVAEATGYSEIYGSISFVALIMGVDASSLVTKMNELASAVYVEAGDAEFEPMSILLVLGREENGYEVALHGSLFNELVSMLEVQSYSVTETAAVTTPVLTAAQLSELDPQMILFSDALDMQALLDSADFSALPAVQQGRTYAIDAALVNRTGPRATEGLSAILDMLEQASIS